MHYNTATLVCDIGEIMSVLLAASEKIFAFPKYDMSNQTVLL